MENSLKYIIEQLQLNLNRTDLFELVEHITRKNHEYNRLKTIERLAFYLSCDYEELDKCYMRLLKESEKGNGDRLADNYVPVWIAIDNFSVNEILDLVE